MGVAAVFIAFGITVCAVALHDSRGGGVMMAVGIVPVLAGVVTVLLNIKKWNDKTPALVFSPQGITINAASFHNGFIPWNDVQMIYEEIFRQLVIIDLKEPEKYLSKQHPVKRFILKLNQKQYGKIVYLSPHNLDCTFDELLMCSVESFDRYLYASNNPA